MSKGQLRNVKSKVTQEAGALPDPRYGMTSIPTVRKWKPITLGRKPVAFQQDAVVVNAKSEVRKIEPISLRRRTNTPRLFRARSANFRSLVECRLASPFVRHDVGTMFYCGTGALRVISAPKLQKGIPDRSRVRYLPVILFCGFAWGQPPANPRCNSCIPYYAGLLLVVMVLTRDPHHSLLRLGRTKCRKTCIFTYRIQRRRGSTNKQGAILLRECRMPWVPVVAYTLVLSCQRAPQGWGEP